LVCEPTEPASTENKRPGGHHNLTTETLLATMGKADLHIHTTFSFDSSCTVSAVLEWAASSTNLDVIAITDHDEFDGALEAVQRGPEFGIEVIPGCEISTRAGHLLALFLKRPVPPGLSLLETVLRVGEQGGLCIAAHPTATLAHGLSAESIRSALQDPDARQVLVGIETMNTGLFFQKANLNAQRINRELRLASTGSSDSHVFWTIGFGYTQFQGYTAADLRQALINHSTSAHSLLEKHSLVYWARHVFHRTLRKMGWVIWAPEPNANLVLRRLAKI
jgi:predicted metal-dependent phosphoesterase TrpH